MEVLESDVRKLKLKEYNLSDIRKITIEEAKEIYKKLDIGPGEEVNIGWSYIPLTYLEDKNSLWLTNSNSILQKIDIRSTSVKRDINHFVELSYKENKDYTIEQTKLMKQRVTLKSFKTWLISL